MDNVTFDLSAFANAIDINLKTVVRRMALDLWTKIVKRTPVDTGRARASWNISIGSPDMSVPPEGKHNAPSAPAAIGGIIGFDQVWISSNVDYIDWLEKGTSKQAPAGMVEISIAELEVEIEHMILQLI